MRKLKLIMMILIILIILLIILAIAGYYILKYLYPQDYKEYVEKYSKMYGVEEELIYAMIKEESNFDKDANSHKSAIGLMQLVQDTADEVGLELGIENVDLRDPETNIQIGTKYLSDLIEKYDGNIKFAIVAYNAGFGNVDKWIDSSVLNEDGSNMENVPFKETNMYLRKVLRTYELYKNLY